MSFVNLDLLKSPATRPAKPDAPAESSPIPKARAHAKHDRKAKRSARKKTRHEEAPALDAADLKVIDEVKQIMDRHERDTWKVGDKATSLVERKDNPVKLATIGRLVGQRHRSTVCRFQKGAVTVNTPELRSKMTIYEGYDLYRAHSDIPSLGLPLDEMVQMYADRETTDRKVNVRTFFLNQAREQRAKEQVRLVAENSGGLIGSKAFLGEWENVLKPVIENGTADLIVADPPFGQYQRLKNGGHSSGRDGGLRRECLFNSAKEALETTLRLIEWSAAALTAEGRLMLCQAGTLPVRKDILEAANRFGLETTDELIWLKEAVSPRDWEGCHGSGTHKFIVFRRKDAAIPDFSNKSFSNADVLFCPSPSQRFVHRLRSGDVEPGEGHAFQMPVALLEYLLLMHCPSGGLVVEPFGCSGVASIAAVKRGFDFRYCEAVEGNFHEGVNRIQRAIDGDTSIYTSDLPDSMPEYVFPPSVANVPAALKRFDALAQAPTVADQIGVTA